MCKISWCKLYLLLEFKKKDSLGIQGKEGEEDVSGQCVQETCVSKES